MDKEQVDNIVDSIHTQQQNQVINTLKDRDIWFTTKQDPTFVEPSSYYELDGYGYPTEKTLKAVEKDCEDYVGDGAIDFTDAINMWIGKCLMDGKLAYKDYLVTKFKNKPVVDDISAYEVKEPKTENKKLNEDDKDTITLKGDSTIVKVVKIDDKKYFNYYYDDVDDTEHWTSKAGPFESEKEAIQMAKKHRPTIKQVKNENYKTRLREENTKSLNLISQMFQSDDFDANSNEGKIVVKTSELFNALSDKGYDVQVGFDNGDSTSTILLGEQGGSVNITITDITKPLQAFTAGSFEITKESLKVLQDILTIIQNVK